VILAVLGLYSLVSFFVSDRTHEIGLRVALGASAGDITRLVLQHGLRWTVAGLAVGLPAALVATRLLRSLLYGISPVDPIAFVAASTLTAIVATLACALPAARAARMNPIATLSRQ